MIRAKAAGRLSRLYETHALRSYVYWKVRTDPAYGAVFDRLLPHEQQSLLDLGCGIGVLPFFLREEGFAAPILGVDFDDRKIEVARKAAQRYRGVDFIVADMRDPLPENHNVVLLDVLQYVDSDAQQLILTNVAAAVPAGGIAIVRQGLRDHSWRHRATRAVDGLARAAWWMRGERLNYPTREQVERPFAAGFEAEVVPLRGRMPFSNYLFVFRRTPITRREAVRPPG